MSLEKPIVFFSSGSTLLDLALGGGWALGRVFNIVGDKSTGKTGLAVEAFANFKRTFTKSGRMRYAEAESAFDDSFAELLGFPPEVERPEELLSTVEEFCDDLYKFANRGGPSLYILDSLDALSDDSEIKRFKDRLAGKEEAGSFGAQKAKEMSQMFRLLVKDMGKKDCSLGIISQVRDNIGVRFGEQHSRSGGKALDFYSTHCVWLSETGKIKRTYNNQERVVGTTVLSKVKKNKVGYPFRTAEYDLVFGYGIDNEKSMVDWLEETKIMTKESAKDIRKNLGKARETKNYATLSEINQQLKLDVTRIWEDIEKNLAPPIQKYFVEEPTK